MIEYIFVITVLIQIVYYGILFRKIQFFKQATKIDNNLYLPVSVIICARNEAENLLSNLPSVLDQDYPEFEVVVVNDGSTDRTMSVLEDFEAKYPQLRILDIPSDEKVNAGKKSALEKGIQFSSHDILLMTDADCFAVSSDWIKSMVNSYEKNSEMVIGISPYVNSGSFLDNMIQYETYITYLQYINFALWGNPYMGVGRNISYTKKLFERVGGFKTHSHITSGDDDLFVQEAIRHTHVSVCLAPNSITKSRSSETLKKWWNQKLRHYTTGSHYLISHQLLLGGFIISKFGMYFTFIYLSFGLSFSTFSILLFFIYYIISLVLLYRQNKKFNLDITVRWLFPLDLIYVVLISMQGMMSKWKNNRNWS